jgi:hypothetical protein
MFAYLGKVWRSIRHFSTFYFCLFLILAALRKADGDGCTQRNM